LRHARSQDRACARATNSRHFADDTQLKAIEDLKDRIKKGDTLEKTQLQKIEGEAQIRSEIEALGGSS
jgi:uncharacterized protein with WD repeat